MPLCHGFSLMILLVFDLMPQHIITHATITFDSHDAELPYCANTIAVHSHTATEDLGKHSENQQNDHYAWDDERLRQKSSGSKNETSTTSISNIYNTVHLFLSLGMFIYFYTSVSFSRIYNIMPQNKLKNKNYFFRNSFYCFTEIQMIYFCII